MAEHNKALKGQFGLVLPQNVGPKRKVAAAPVASEFNIDDSEEKMLGALYGSGALRRTKRKVEEEHSKVLESDPLAFSYDEVFDDIQQSKSATRESKGRGPSAPKESKYIAKIKEQAETRNKDLMKAQDRKFEKERNVDAHLYEDKPSFVTERYKQHLKEMDQWNERRAKQDAVDEKNSVDKRKDMNMFHMQWAAIASGTSSRMKETQPTTKSDDATSPHTQPISSPNYPTQSPSPPHTSPPQITSSLPSPSITELSSIKPESEPTPQDAAPNPTDTTKPEQPNANTEADRESKLAAARERYKQRKGARS
eukprot:c23882_g1_i1.p1 GENE.c23882_g1_i1~~c23882_g1_i1.p1  ORF type:complete len:320 (-),score=81.38 c23882_g1_i1:161-1090(-)